MSNDKGKAGPDTQEPSEVNERPRKVVEQEANEDIQHGRQAQRPDVNPSTNVQPGHRDREQI